MNNDQLIAIRIKNPEGVRRNFGECSGDYSKDPVKYWVGTRDLLHPAPEIPSGALLINAPVSYCGGGASVKRTPRNRVELRERSADALGFWTFTSVASGLISDNYRASKALGDNARWWGLYYLQILRRIPALPLP